MGQYVYLVNRKEKIIVEAYKLSGGGEESLEIEEEKKLVAFLEHCRIKQLTIECVSEHWFFDNQDFDNPYKEHEVMARKEPPEDMDDYPYGSCMNCSSIWSPGTEEYDFQQCDACGWMPGEPVDDDEPDDDFDYDEWEQDNDPNDSRNL